MKDSSSLKVECTPSVEDSPKRSSSPWIVAPTVDLLLVIGTPLLIFPLLTLAQYFSSSAQITSFAFIWAIGHHLPGMMRAYGDQALFRRFRTRFVVAPLLLLVVGVYSVAAQSSAIPLGIAIWGWWHYLMQTYGFLRIYDGKVRSVAPLTCGLDQAMCLVWFAGAIVLTDNGLFGFLNRFYQAGGFVVSADMIVDVKLGVFAAMVVVTGAFVVHGLVQLWRGQFPSILKLALMVSTFGYYWYCLATVSNLFVAYALFEIFHDIQYLTIVWVFNEKRAEKDSRAGAFTRLLFRRQWQLVACYLGLILVYGLLNHGTREMVEGPIQKGLLGFFMASTLLHYYYDGFIWKLREAETRTSLGLTAATASTRAGGWRPVFTSTMVALPVCGLTWLVVREQSRPEFDQARHASLVSALPRCVFAHHNHGIALSAAGHLEEAEAAYRQALKLNPFYAEAHYNLGSLLARKGDADAALIEFRETLQLDSRHVDANYNLGVLLLIRGQNREAISLFETALENAPLRAEIHGNLGSALALSGRRKAAINHFRRALELNPDLVELHGILARDLDAEGDSSGALEHHRQAIALQPDSAVVHFNLGTFLESRQQLSEAVAAYRSALSLNPHAVDAWINLGAALAKQNQMNDAAQAFRRAIELAPDNSTAKLNLQRAESLLQPPAP